MHKHTKEVDNRLSRVIGQLEGIKRMIVEERECTEILNQISAVRSAVTNIGKIVLSDHIENCLADAYEKQDAQKVEELNNAIQKLIK